MIKNIQTCKKMLTTFLSNYVAELNGRYKRGACDMFVS